MALLLLLLLSLLPLNDEVPRGGGEAGVLLGHIRDVILGMLVDHSYFRIRDSHCSSQQHNHCPARYDEIDSGVVVAIMEKALTLLLLGEQPIAFVQIHPI